MKAAGIDLGGTKIEAQLFDDNWQLMDKRRVATPSTYPDLIDAVTDQINWIQTKATCPIGIGAAGLINANSHALTANLPAMDQKIVEDIQAHSGASITYLNDCRAFALSEAVFGAGQGYQTVLGLSLGTGVGAGICVDGKLISDPQSVGGEIGHIAAPASVICRAGLPIFGCGCGREGCYESYVSGPGLIRIVQHISGQQLKAPEIAKLRNDDRSVDQAWNIWLEIAGELIVSMIMSIDPDVVILGGGLSNIDGICTELRTSVEKSHLKGFRCPDILLAQGGDSSGGRGAALAAYQGQTS